MSMSDSDVEGSLARLRGNVSGLREELRSTAQKWGTTTQRIRWVIKTIIAAVFELVLGLVLFILDLFMWSWEIGLLLLVGITGIALRDLVLALCPIMLHQYKFATGIINAILGFMEAGVDVAITALDAIFVVVNTLIRIANAISKLSGHGKLTNFQFHLIHWIPITSLSYTQVKEALTTLPPTCANFDTSGKVLKWFFQLGLNAYTCPVVRFVFPDPAIYDLADAVLGFTIRGSPRPDLFSPTDNCSEGVDTNMYDYACAGMGVSFVMLDTFLAIVILYLFLKDLWSSVSKLIQLVLYFIVVGSEDIHEMINITLSILFF